MSKVLVFTATFNEYENVQDLIKSILFYLPDADILIVDDNSPDGTGRMLQKMCERQKQLNVIHRHRKLGLGTAHKIAKKYAVEHEYDVLVTMDADFSHDPKYLPELIREMENNEFVIGSRYTKGGKCDYGFKRAVISKTANHLARFLLGIRLRETTTSYRAFKRSLLLNLDIDNIKSNGYSFFVESLYNITKITNKTSEFPIHFQDRRSGISKISKTEIFKAIFTLLRLFFKRIFNIKKTVVSSENQDPHNYINCNFCGHPYYVEIYPSTSKDLQKDVYACTNTHHSSHGRIVKCLTCGLVYTNPQVHVETINEHYSNVEDDIYVKNIISRKKTFKYNMDKIRSFLPNQGKLLDVGAYCGIFLDVSKNYGYEVYGIEPSIWAVNFSKEHFGINIFAGFLKNLPESVKDFDVITAWDVLEHSTDPMLDLSMINKILKPDGIFAFSTLDIDNWFPKLLGEKWPWIMDMHLYYYNVDILKEMLIKNNFEVIDVQSYSHIITLEYFLFKLESINVWGVGLFRKLFKNKLFRKIYIPFRFGDIKMITCRKVVQSKL